MGWRGEAHHVGAMATPQASSCAMAGTTPFMMANTPVMVGSVVSSRPRAALLQIVGRHHGGVFLLFDVPEHHEEHGGNQHQHGHHHEVGFSQLLNPLMAK